MISFGLQYNTVWGENLGVLLEGYPNPIPLHTNDGHWWEAAADVVLPLPEGSEVGYRYAVWYNGELVRCESGRQPHRLTWEGAFTFAVHHDAWTDLPEEDYERIAGSAVPVFSLRSEGSQGVGDFGDLRAMIDWCVRTGQRALQILPINDTTKSGKSTDSYPYSSISTFALHPMYLDLRQLTPLHTKKAQNILDKLAELNKKPALDYAAVNTWKHKYLRLHYSHTGQQTMQSSIYTDFYETNKDWLLPYAAYCHLRDKYGTPCFKNWNTLTTFNQEKVATLLTAEPKSLGYYLWLQFLLHLQLQSVSAYARANNVLIKGDIPIGIDPTSVDAWQTPHLFNTSGTAGAPPDDFSADGQNWGFPTYNWEAMAEDGYAWWKRRFQKMAEYFDAYRIDHVLGFFRIWEVPTNGNAMLGQFSPALPLTASEISDWGIPFNEEHYADTLFVRDRLGRGWHPRIMGYRSATYENLPEEQRSAYDRLYEHYFYHRHNHFWYEQAMLRLPSLINTTSLIPCGEDLGMVPACVPWVMRLLHIHSLEVERMPKAFGVSFGDTSTYPAGSVCTIGTHDMSTLRGWWKESAEITQRYFNEVLGHAGKAPIEASAALCEEVVKRHLESPSALCILAVQDWLAMDEELRLPDADAERINVPANPKHYWQYRMHITLEELLQAKELNNKIYNLIHSTR